MLGDTLVFLKKQLNTYLRSQNNLGDNAEDPVVFLDGQTTEPLTFKLGAVTMMLINIEEDTVLRAADPYVRVNRDGSRQRTNPDLRLNLSLLIIARYKQYEDSLNSLSGVIKYFQANRLIDHQTHPDLPARIEKLIIELITMPLGEQSDVWGTLRIAYQPSVMYRVKMIVFRDEMPSTGPSLEEMDIEASTS